MPCKLLTSLFEDGRDQKTSENWRQNLHQVKAQIRIMDSQNALVGKALVPGTPPSKIILSNISIDDANFLGSEFELYMGMATI